MVPNTIPGSLGRELRLRGADDWRRLRMLTSVAKRSDGRRSSSGDARSSSSSSGGGGRGSVDLQLRVPVGQRA